MSKNAFGGLRDRKPATLSPVAEITPTEATRSKTGTAPSRQGKKAVTGYFSPEMSLALHMTARKNEMTLQDAMREAFNDWLRKYGVSPVGD